MASNLRMAFVGGWFFLILLQPFVPCLANSADVEIKKALSQCPPSVRPSDCVDSEELSVHIIKIYHGYAHVTVGRADGSGDIDTAYLKKERNHWILLDEGANIDLRALGIPKELW